MFGTLLRQAVQCPPVMLPFLCSTPGSLTSLVQAIHQYIIVGRRKPTENGASSLFRMRIFAPNVVVAKSRFWYYMSSLKKVKRANGEIVSVNEVFEKNPNQIKNFGVWIRYDSRSGTHNMYKEVRDITINGAIEKICRFP